MAAPELSSLAPCLMSPHLHMRGNHDVLPGASIARDGGVDDFPPAGECLRLDHRAERHLLSGEEGGLHPRAARAEMDQPKPAARLQARSR